MKPTNRKAIADWSNKSGIGLPHSMTLTRLTARHPFREVLECGCPLPLCVCLSSRFLFSQWQQWFDATLSESEGD